MTRRHATAANLWTRLRLDGFRFWRDVGGPLEVRPREPLRLSGIWHLLGYFRHVWPAAVGLVGSIFLAAAIGVLPAFTQIPARPVDAPDFSRGTGARLPPVFACSERAILWT